MIEDFLHFLHCAVYITLGDPPVIPVPTICDECISRVGHAPFMSLQRQGKRHSTKIIHDSLVPML